MSLPAHLSSSGVAKCGASLLFFPCMLNKQLEFETLKQKNLALHFVLSSIIRLESMRWQLHGTQ